MSTYNEILQRAIDNLNSLQDNLSKLQSLGISPSSEKTEAIEYLVELSNNLCAIKKEDGTFLTGDIPYNGEVNETIDGITRKEITLSPGYFSGGSFVLDDTIDNELVNQQNLINQISEEVLNLNDANYLREYSILDRSATEYTNYKLETVGAYAFADCENLETVQFNSVTRINSNAFLNCTNLKKLIIKSPSMATLEDVNAFSNSGILNIGYIYVPDELLIEYKNATNWVIFETRFKGLKELT